MTTTEYVPHYTNRFWAKAKPYRQQGPERIHLLEHHLAEVGACFESLLAQPIIGNCEPEQEMADLIRATTLYIDLARRPSEE